MNAVEALHELVCWSPAVCDQHKHEVLHAIILKVAVMVLRTILLDIHQGHVILIFQELSGHDGFIEPLLEVLKD